ncbi:hypothetical protein [Salicola sp. Rm-C-2C1-2]|uniref:hypothetical protein n=1 Tax=Salicola sp. Rm-C-2C1-2 TaxID=3141321 RepID=UPI0032E45B3F
MVASDSEKVLARLLEAHVQHELARMDTNALREDLEREVGYVFEAADRIRMNDVISAETVNGIIHRHTVAREMPAVIPEMAATFTQEVIGSAFHRQATLADIMDRQRLEGFVDQVLLLREQRQQLIDRMLDQPVYRELVANLMYEAIVRYVYEENLLSRRVPGVGSALRFSSKMLNKAVSGLDEVWEKSIKSSISRNVEKLTRQSADFLAEHLTDQELKTSVMDAWDAFCDRPLEELAQGLGEVEWSEFVVMGYDYWLAFRKSDYYRNAYETVVNRLFEFYGDRFLGELLAEFNIDQATVMTEVDAVLPQVLEALKANGLLEGIVRRRLEAFYTSEAALSALAE